MEHPYRLLGTLNLPGDIKKLNYEELQELAQETRQALIRSVSANGGHLAPSLGVVELTIALLRLCDPAKDRILWDVSHQSYPFKILTDRFSTFHTLRTFGGLSGFTKLSESPYDAFGAGHASTSISAGFGMVCADALFGRARKVITVIGDASLSGGMAFEALNCLGSSKKPMVVILNDNEMSIGKNVGAMSVSLSRMVTGELSTNVRKEIRELLENIPLGAKLRQLARKFEESALSFFTPGILFEELGLRYVGPIDGHKIKELEKALQIAFDYNRPVLVHVATTKGKGYAHAEENPQNFHGVSAFDIATGKPVKKSDKKSWTRCFGEKLVNMAGQDDRIVAITAAMSEGTGLQEFSRLYPDRFYDVGIAEEHAMTFAAGLAVAGARPYIALYSTFLQRAFDQVIHDVALQNLPVRICIDRAGLVGQDGPTHHGTFDISFLRIIPNLALMVPKDTRELEEMMALSLDWEGPLAIRYPRGVPDIEAALPHSPVVAGEPEIISGKGDYAIVSVGHIFGEAWKFYHKVIEAGYSCRFINLRFINPLNKEKLVDALSGSKAVYTFEENVRAGGAGEMIALILAEKKFPSKIHIMALPDEFITHGTVNELRNLVGLTAEHAWEIFQQDL